MTEEENKKTELTPQQLKEAKDAFDIFDRDSDGKISENELATVMRSLGQNPSQKEVKELMSTLDLDNSGQISFEEFCRLWCAQLDEVETEDDIVDAFRVFDKDSHGKIQATELVSVLKGLGDPMTQEDIDDMIQQAHPDKDGLIDYAEFVHRIMNS